MKTIFAAIILLVAAFGYGAEAESFTCDLGESMRNTPYICNKFVVTYNYDVAAGTCVVDNKLYNTHCNVGLSQSECGADHVAITETSKGTGVCTITTV